MPVRHCALPPDPTTVSREFTVAGGRFAPGHLGELTQVLPFELVDAVLEETLTVQRRLRDLPSRVGVYFVLAMCLFPEHRISRRPPSRPANTQPSDHVRANVQGQTIKHKLSV